MIILLLHIIRSLRINTKLRERLRKKKVHYKANVKRDIELSVSQRFVNNFPYKLLSNSCTHKTRMDFLKAWAKKHKTHRINSHKFYLIVVHFVLYHVTFQAWRQSHFCLLWLASCFTHKALRVFSVGNRTKSPGTIGKASVVFIEYHQKRVNNGRINCQFLNLCTL